MCSDRTKRGHYKVLTSLALSGGLYATYYAGAGGQNSFYPKGGISAFHRGGQTGNAEQDFVSPCYMREWKSGVPLSTHECASPGYDWTDTDLETTGTAQAGTSTSITLAASSSPVDNMYTGMHILMYGGKAADSMRVVTNYVGATKVATIAEVPEAPDTTTKYKIGT